MEPEIFQGICNLLPPSGGISAASTIESSNYL